MGILGNMFSGDNLYRIGAALKDIGDGSSENLTAAEKMLAGRAAQQRKAQGLAQLQQILAGQTQPLNAGNPSVESMVAGQMTGAEGAPSLAQVTARPMPKMPSLRDGRTPAQLLALATSNPDEVGLAMKMLEANAPRVKVGPDGTTYDEGDPGVLDRTFANRTNVNGTIVDLNDASNTNRYVPDAPVKGAQPVYDNLGRVVDWSLPQGAQRAIGAASQAETTGRTMGSVYNSPNGDGSTSPMLGVDVFGGGRVSTGGGVGGGQGGARRTLTPGEAKAQEVDYTAGAQTIASAGDARNKAANTARQYGDALRSALSLDSNNLTGVKLGLAKSFRALGFDNPNLEQFVATAEGLRQLTTQMVLPMAKELGANPSNKDAEIIMKSQPSLTTPKQVAVVTFATNAALNNKEAARQEFFANYTGPQSKAALQRAWAASPQAAASIYQDPVWQQMTLNGKPAVMIPDKPYKDGKRYGIFMPGTPRQQVFEVH